MSFAAAKRCERETAKALRKVRGGYGGHAGGVLSAPPAFRRLGMRSKIGRRLLYLHRVRVGTERVERAARGARVCD